MIAFLIGCASDPAVLEAFEAARGAALADPPDLAHDWAPDAVLHLSPSAVDEALAIGLRQVPPLVERIPLGGGVTVVPELQIRSAQLVGEGSCNTCARVDVALGGKLGFESTVLGRGEGPVAATATVEVQLATKAIGKRDGVMRVTADPIKVTRVDLGFTRLPRSISATVEEQVRAHVEALLVNREPTVIAQVSRAGLPMLGFRVEPEGMGLRVAMRTEAPSPGVVVPKARGKDDWHLEVAQASLLSIARREAFLREPIAPGIVPVPEHLAVKGDRFELGLRLWRVTGRTWWRDYTITGTVGVEQDQLVLTATGVTEGARSPGARSADPLAALAEGLILTQIADAASATRPLPTSMQTKAGKTEATVTVTRVAGRGEVLVVAGSLGLSGD